MQPIDVNGRVWTRVQKILSGQTSSFSGAWSEAEREALELYGALAMPRKGRLAIGQIGQSLDGRIATVSGDAQDISGTEGLAHLHRLRALMDAVVIGVGTAVHDNPRLTVRLADGRSPAKVVIDPKGRLPNDTAFLHDDSARRIVIQSADKARPAGVEVIRLPRGQWLCPRAILDALAAEGLRRVLIEGGGTTIAQFLEADALDHLHVAVAPLLIGAGPQGLTTSPVATLAQARRPETSIYNLGTDILFACNFASDLQPRVTHPQLPHSNFSVVQ